MPEYRSRIAPSDRTMPGCATAAEGLREEAIALACPSPESGRIERPGFLHGQVELQVIPRVATIRRTYRDVAGAPSRRTAEFSWPKRAYRRINAQSESVRRSSTTAASRMRQSTLCGTPRTSSAGSRIRPDQKKAAVVVLPVAAAFASRRRHAKSNGPSGRLPRAKQLSSRGTSHSDEASRSCCKSSRENSLKQGSIGKNGATSK